MHAYLAQDSQEITIDAVRRQAFVGAAASVTELRAAAAGAGLTYPYRPVDADTTVDDQLRRSATCFAAWLRHGSPFRSVAEVGVLARDGRATVLHRDERLGTVQRDLVAALRAGAQLTHVVLDLVAPATHRTSMIASFEDRLAATTAAHAVIAVGRPTAVDVVDETAMTVLAGFGGLGMYSSGTSLFIELADGDPADLARDTMQVENLCFELGATSIRECSDNDDIAAAMETLVTSVRPVLGTIGFRMVHEAVVPAADLPRYVDGVCAIEKLHGRVLVVMVEGATSTVTCWALPTISDDVTAQITHAIDRLAAAAGAVVLGE